MRILTARKERELSGQVEKLSNAWLAESRMLMELVERQEARIQELSDTCEFQAGLLEKMGPAWNDHLNLLAAIQRCYPRRRKQDVT